MENFVLSMIAKGAIVLLLIFGLIMCIFWYPFSISLNTVGISPMPPSAAEKVQMYTQLALCWACSIPCFAVLALLWLLTNMIGMKRVFEHRTSRTLKICAVILSVDAVAFAIGNIVIINLEWDSFAIVNFVLCGIALAASGFLAVLSHYTKQAAILKEETDGLI